MIYQEYEKRLQEARGLYPTNKEITKEDYTAKKLVYSNKFGQIGKDFKEALFKEYDVENNPKREKLWDKAWDLGHISGFSEVETFFDDLVELIK